MFDVGAGHAGANAREDRLRDRATVCANHRDIVAGRKSNKFAGEVIERYDSTLGDSNTYGPNLVFVIRFHIRISE